MSAPDVRAVVEAGLRTVQGTKHHLGLVTLQVLTDRVTEAVTPLVPTETEAYDGELAMLRGLVDTLYAAVQADDLLAVKQALFHHTVDREQAARQADLLTAIRAYGGRWKSGRAVRALRELGHHPVSPGTAAGDLNALAIAGHLTRHDEPGVTYYTRKDHRP